MAVKADGTNNVADLGISAHPDGNRRLFANVIEFAIGDGWSFQTQTANGISMLNIQHNGTTFLSIRSDGKINAP